MAVKYIKSSLLRIDFQWCLIFSTKFKIIYFKGILKYFKIISLCSIQEDKKKRDRDRVENETEKDPSCQAPVGLDVPPEKPLAGSLAKQEGWNN